jgi:hypothetical protein
MGKSGILENWNGEILEEWNTGMMHPILATERDAT